MSNSEPMTGEQIDVTETAAGTDAQLQVNIEFTETMKGNLELEGTSVPLSFTLTITIPNLRFFFLDPAERGYAKGFIESEALGGRLAVEDGVFHLFVDADQPDAYTKFMRYELPFVDSTGKARLLTGHKIVRDDGIFNVWRDTTTLFCRMDGGAEATLRILPADLLRQLFTFKASGPSWWARAKGLLSFFSHFLKTLWSIYFSSQPNVRIDETRERDIPLLTLAGVQDAEITQHPLQTDDKMGLSMHRFKRRECQDVVVLLHGLSTSTDMFIMPEHYNLVSYLLDHGYEDVFSFDWRGSMRYPYDTFPNTFNMDDVALFDHPAAFSRIRELVGPEARIHVICHCVGSLSFMMSLYAGLIDVASVICNSVSLTPQINTPAKIKSRIAPFFLAWVLRFPNLNPRWARLPGPGVPQGKILAKIVSWFHPECDVPECHMLSFMWGYGHPAVYVHANMLDVTHRRVGDLFGSVALSFYLHIRKCTNARKSVKFHERDERYNALPNDYLDRVGQVDTPMLLVSGDHNHVFPRSNLLTHDLLQYLKSPAPVEYRWLPGYGHQDPFMGKHAADDVFPLFLEHLQKHSIDIRVSEPAQQSQTPLRDVEAG